MSPGPIPWHLTVDYAERAGLEPGMIEPFTRIIQKLDDAYLGWVREESEGRVRADRREADREAKRRG